MEKLNIGTDEIAAHNLLIAFGIDPAAGNLEEAAKHFRTHRESAERLQMEAAAESLLKHLETAFMEHNELQKGEQGTGYAAAEQEAMNWFFDNAPKYLDIPSVSKGKLLRAMVRDQNRKRAAVAHKRL